MRLSNLLVLLVSVVALAGCSWDGGDRDAVATTRPAPTASTTVRTVPTTTTVVVESTTTTALTDEEQVLAVFDAYMGFEFDERTNGYGPSEERIEQYTTGALKQRATETLQARKDAEAFLVGRTTTRIESITVDGDTAEVLACYLDTTTAFFADGSVADPAGNTPTLERLVLTPNGEAWLISERFAGGDIPCEL